MSTIFVVRETNHPEADLARNWSAPVGGFSDGELVGMSFASAEEAKAYWTARYEGAVAAPAFRLHPAYEGFVEVHYEGLGAWLLEAEALEEAVAEAGAMNIDFVGTMEAGDGHFMASDVVSFHQVREGLYVFEITC